MGEGGFRCRTSVEHGSLEQDQELQQRTCLSIENILSLLEFCINSTYFSFQGKFYEQLEGVAMGSPLSPIVANLYIESFEVEANISLIIKKFKIIS